MYTLTEKYATSGEHNTPVAVRDDPMICKIMKITVGCEQAVNNARLGGISNTCQQERAEAIDPVLAKNNLSFPDHTLQRPRYC